MNFRYLLYLILFLSISCTPTEKTTDSLLHYVPKEAAIIIKIDDLSALKSELKNNELLSKWKNTSLYDSIVNKIDALHYIFPKAEAVLSFSEKESQNFEFVFATHQTPNLFHLEEATDMSVETFSLKNHSFQKHTINNTTYYSTLIKNIAVISSSQPLLEQLLVKGEEDEISNTLNKLYQMNANGKSASLFVNARASNTIAELIGKEGVPLIPSDLADWFSLDLSMSQEHIHFTGLSIPNDTLTAYANLFKNTKPLTNTTANFTPASADAILSYTFDDYGVFAQNQQKYLNRNTLLDSLFNTVEEIGTMYLKKDKVVLLNTFGADNISQYLDNLKTTAIDYQGNEIISLSNNDFLNALFNPLVQKFEANHYIILENTFVFGSNTDVLQTVIRNHKNGTTFNTNAVFKTAEAVLADESSLLYIAKNSGVSSVLDQHFSKEVSDSFKASQFSKYAFATQLVADHSIFHTNIVLHKTESTAKKNAVSTLFTVKLDGKIATNPQFVENHQTRNKEIVVQDEQHNLYLISAKGKVLWKKQLDGPIQGKIKQVDLYKNGRLQLAFTTTNQFLILDRNGKEVAPFTFSYDGPNLNPLAVFDYENKKNYRFVITQEKTIRMYNNKAEIVKGFTYTTAKSSIKSIPQHFKIGSKDYLVFQEAAGDLKILNRIGKTRVPVRTKIKFSDNLPYLYKNKFSVTDSAGTLFQIDTKGALSQTKFHLNQDHGMDATSKTLALMDDNVLRIKGKKATLELGLYSKPQIFYINDKIYVSVTDLQNQKIYLFDSAAKTIRNFPVIGSSIIDLSDMNKDGKLELVSKDNANSLIVYTMH